MEDVEGTAGAKLSPADQDPDLDTLVYTCGLSVRGYNVCVSAGLTRLSAIRAHALRHGGFHTLPNCGRKTQIELETIVCRSGYIEAPVPANEPSPTVQQSADPEYLKQVCASLFMGLGTRARNIMLSHAGGSTPDDLIRFFLQHGRKLPKLPGAGAMVMAELRAMRRSLLAALDGEAALDGLEPDTRTPVERWADRHRVPRATLAELAPSSGELYLLRYVQKALTAGHADRTALIAQELLCHSGAEDSLADIALRHGLSRERVRQLRARMDRTVPALLSPIADLPGVHEHYRDLVTAGDLLFIRPEQVVQWNGREGTTWSPLLFQFLAVVLNAQRLIVLPWRGMTRAGQDRETAGDRPVVLVAEELMESLEAAFALARFHHERPRVTPMALAIDVLVKDLPTERIDRVRAMLIQLLPEQYPGTTVDGHTWCLPPNAQPDPRDLLESVLEDLGEPVHIDRILSTWNIRYPSRPTTLSAIRSLVLRDRARFFSVGRTSTYGLRRWESERRSVKGGTIRDIVAEYLAGMDAPAHMDAIEQHVRQYRPSTHAGSIRLNLKMDTTGRFLFLPNGVIGLAGKRYDGALPAPPIRVKSSHLRTTVLRRFIGKHRRELATYLAERSGADPYSVYRAIEGVVASGRLTIDAQRIIRHVQAGSPGPGNHELPLEWSV